MTRYKFAMNEWADRMAELGNFAQNEWVDRIAEMEAEAERLRKEILKLMLKLGKSQRKKAELEVENQVLREKLENSHLVRTESFKDIISPRIREVKGVCRICHGVFKLYADGTVWRHNSWARWPIGELCEGTRKKPSATERLKTTKL